MRRKKVMLFILICFTSATLIWITAFHQMYLQHKSPAQIICLEENNVYIDGRIVCDKRQGVKYLSYQPPGGGWNNQRIVFENAVVLAKLLNRTLIVHPLAPHLELLQIHMGDYERYNLLPKEKLLPLSNVMDLKLLSKLIPVKEFMSSHVEFQNSSNHLRWAQICHNGLLGIWVDTIPRETDAEKWKLLRRQMNKSLPAYQNIPSYRRICKTELKKFEADNVRPVWGIMNELAHRNEELMYFSEGCLRQGLFFFDRKTVLNTHEWIVRFVQFAPEIWKRVMAVLEAIKNPFNAIHVRRSDHPSSFQVKQKYWLKKLKANRALKLTRKLYIATDEKNKTWFQPFRKAGYNLFFAEDFEAQLSSNSIDSTFDQDILGVCEQLICAHADKFVGSYYSSFTMFIKRLKQQLTWKKGMLLLKPYATKWIKNHKRWKTNHKLRKL